MQHSTPQNKNTINIDASPIHKHDEPNSCKRITSDSISNNESRIDEPLDQSKNEEKFLTDKKK